MIVYKVSDHTGAPVATVRAEGPDVRPTDITAASPRHVPVVRYVEDLMRIYPSATTSMLLTRFGPYSKVEVESDDEEAVGSEAGPVD